MESVIKKSRGSAKIQIQFRERESSKLSIVSAEGHPYCTQEASEQQKHDNSSASKKTKVLPFVGKELCQPPRE
jgi:hypothetical protein